MRSIHHRRGSEGRRPDVRTLSDYPRRPGTLTPAHCRRAWRWGILGLAVGAAGLIGATELLDAATPRAVFMRLQTARDQSGVVHALKVRIEALEKREKAVNDAWERQALVLHAQFKGQPESDLRDALMLLAPSSHDDRV